MAQKSVLTSISQLVASLTSTNRMAATLTVSAKASPFPWAAAGIATYTQKSELVFDESASGVTLDLAGSKLTEEDEIVRALAKAGGLSDESVKVCVINLVPIKSRSYLLSRPSHSLLWQSLYQQSPPFRISQLLWIPLMII